MGIRNLDEKMSDIFAAIITITLTRRRQPAERIAPLFYYIIPLVHYLIAEAVMAWDYILESAGNGRSGVARAAVRYYFVSKVIAKRYATRLPFNVKIFVVTSTISLYREYVFSLLGRF